MEQSSSAPAHPGDPTPYEKRLKAAKWLARQGFGIVLLPVPVLGDCGCPPKSTTRVDGKCKSPGKHPLGDDWQHHAAHTPDEVTRLVPNQTLQGLRQFGAFPESGSGLLVLDEDVPGRMQEVAERAQIALPATFTVLTSVDATTGERKRHKYWRIPAGMSEKDVPRTWIGGEVRVDGSGQVVGPWSQHPSGVLYEPEAGTPAEIAVLPAEFIAAMRRGVKERQEKVYADETRTLHKGDGRHQFLVESARMLYKGGLRGDELREKVIDLDATRCEPPYGPDECKRICVWVEENVEAWVTGVVIKGVPGQPGAPEPEKPRLRVVGREEFEYEVAPVRVGEFPLPPEREMLGSTGAIMAVGELSKLTQASEVGLLAAFLSIWSGMWGAHFDLYERQPTNLFAVLVGDTASGRKGTTTRTVWAMLEEVFAPSPNAAVTVSLYDGRWDGLASGQGFLRQMKDAPIKRGVAIEEEFENVLRGARSSQNYASTLGTTIQKAFDGTMLQHITVRGSYKVEPGYTVGILGNITREVLRTVLPPEFVSGGFANRFLWLPVREREGTIDPTRGGNVSAATASYLRECRAFAVKHPTLSLHRSAAELVQDYYRYLSAMTGTASQFARRLHVIAARVGAVHALLDQNEVIEVGHVMAGIALTEYARRGLLWTFGDETGDEWLDLVVENLRVEPEGLPTRAIAALLQRHPARIERVKNLGVEAGLITLEAIKSQPGKPGRQKIVWRHARTSPLEDFVRTGHEGTPIHNARSDSDARPISLDHVAGAPDEQSVESEQIANNQRTSSDPIPNVSPTIVCYSFKEHQSLHFRGNSGWVCPICSPEEGK